MSTHTAGPNQIRGIAARLCWEHPGYGDFISKKDASDALHQYADEMEADTVHQAAPELLEALREMLRTHTACIDTHDGTGEVEMGNIEGEWMPARAQAVKAIAKAEGS